MRLTAKLVSLLVAGMILVLAIEAVISIHRDVEVFEVDMRRDANQLGRTLKDLTEDVWRTNGQQRALQLIEDANEEELLVSVRWVWLDARAGDTYRPRAPAERLEPVGRGQQISLQERDETGRGFLYTYIPLEVDTPRPGTLEFARSLDAFDKFRRDTIIRTIVVAIALLLGSGLAVAVLGVFVVGRPLSRLLEKTRRIGQGDMSGALDASSRDELGELAGALNEMCQQLAEAHVKLQAETEARINALEQLRHADRLATVGRLAAGVAHELGTPMNVASARAGMILEEEVPPAVSESAQIIKVQIEKMTTIIRQLLDFARNRHPKKSAESLRELVVQAADMLAILAGKSEVEVRIVDSEEDLTVNVDGGQCQQVVTNLLENAIHAMPSGGRVTVDIRSIEAHPPEGEEASAGSYVRLDVVDEGVGIDEQNLKEVFDPFFTTKDVGEGTGLGLSIVYGIVREHGGWIEVNSEPGQRTCFSVFLPID